MPDVDEFEDFQDEALEENAIQVGFGDGSDLQNFSVNAASLLMVPNAVVNKQSRFFLWVKIDDIEDEDTMKAEIQDLIDQTDNKEVAMSFGR